MGTTCLTRLTFPSIHYSTGPYVIGVDYDTADLVNFLEGGEATQGSEDSDSLRHHEAEQGEEPRLQELYTQAST